MMIQMIKKIKTITKREMFINNYLKKKKKCRL